MIFNTVHHHIRNKANLTILDYCLLESIYLLSNNPMARYNGWCNAPKDYFAYLTSSRNLVKRYDHLTKAGYLEFKDDKKRMLKRTTQKYYEDVYQYVLGVKKYGVNKVHGGGEQSAQLGVNKVHGNGEQSAPNKNSNKNTNKNINSQSGTQSEIDSLKKELKQLKAKKQNNQYTPALTLVTAKKEIDRLYTTDSLHQLFCTSVKPFDKKIVKLAKESFILKYSFDRYPIFNQDKLQTALFKWIANQRPEYKTQTQTQTNKITASTQMTRQECIDANLENGFDF